MDDLRPPICMACGVTMVPASLSSREPLSAQEPLSARESGAPDAGDGAWICLECEETGDDER